MYNETVIDHFNNPRNVGELNTTAKGEVSSPVCGCAAAIASSSMLTTMAIGKTLAEAKAITNDDVVKSLGGLPEAKIHCSVLAADALRKAIENYEKEHPENA